MKINITIEATPEEVREAMGLPNLSSIQKMLMGKLTDQVNTGNMDVSSMMELINPKQNIWGKLFMDAALKNMEIMTMSSKKPDAEGKNGPEEAA